jgi:hypothetical protein
VERLKAGLNDGEEPDFSLYYSQKGGYLSSLVYVKRPFFTYFKCIGKYIIILWYIWYILIKNMDFLQHSHGKGGG